MQHYLLAFALALLACTALTPVVRMLATRLGAVSSPGGRHVNARSIPRLGGLAITLAWCIPLLGLSQLHPQSRAAMIDHERQLLGVMGGGALMCMVGALDDLRGLRAYHKLLAQALVATMAFALGFRIQLVFLPFVGTLDMGVFALVITVLWIVGITNAVNLIDGLDGLAAGVSFFAALTSFIVAYLTGDLFVALFMAALMGTLVGFLFFNFNPARIFMGDSGSYFLGYVLATMSLAGAVQQKASTAVSLLIPVLALGVPIFDTLLSMVRRVLERRPLFSPDRGHIHHRLLELGLTHRRAVILLYAVSVVLAAGAIAVSLGRAWEIGLALFVISVVFIALVRFLGYFEYLHARRRQKARIYDPHTEVLRRTIPAALAQLERAHSEDDVLVVLSSLVQSSGFARIGILASEVERCSWHPATYDPAARNLVRVSFPIGRDDRARAQLVFEWLSDHDAAPQSDILLQVLVDSVARSLDRAASALGPQRVTHPEFDVDAARIPAPTSP